MIMLKTFLFAQNLYWHNHMSASSKSEGITQYQHDRRGTLSGVKKCATGSGIAPEVSRDGIKG
jgi:hypothetical protein